MTVVNYNRFTTTLLQPVSPSTETFCLKTRPLHTGNPTWRTMHNPFKAAKLEAYFHISVWLLVVSQLSLSHDSPYKLQPAKLSPSVLASCLAQAAIGCGSCDFGTKFGTPSNNVAVVLCQHSVGRSRCFWHIWHTGSVLPWPTLFCCSCFTALLAPNNVLPCTCKYWFAISALCFAIAWALSQTNIARFLSQIFRGPFSSKWPLYVSYTLANCIQRVKPP